MLVGIAPVALVAGPSSAASDESFSVAFAPPAVGSHGSYSDGVVIPNAYVVPAISIDGGSAGATYTATYSITGTNSAGCAISANGSGFSYAHAGTCVISVTVSGNLDNDDDSDTAKGTLTLTVKTGTQTISVTPVSGSAGTALTLVATGYLGTGAITFAVVSGGSATGCAVSANQLTATSAGTCLVTATIAADSNYGSATSAPATMTFQKVSQTIAVTPASGPAGTALTLVATGYLGTGAITFAVVSGGSATGCAVSGNQLTATSAGTCLVTATIAADSNYGSATSAPATMTFQKLSQTIFVTPASGPAKSALTLVATGYSGTGAITFAVVSGGTASGCAVSGNQLTATSAGTCVVTATIAADSNYGSATSAPATMTFNHLPQSISVSAQTGALGSPLALSATGYSGTGAITFAVVSGGTASGCAVSGSQLTASVEGTCLVTATIAADSTYLTATSAPGTMTFVKAIFAGQLQVTASSETVKAGDPVNESGSVSGTQAGDSAVLTAVTYTYSGSGLTTYGPSSAVPTAPGTYTVVPSQATIVIAPSSDQGHYSSTYLYNPGTLVITGAVLTVTASGGSIVAGTSFVPVATVTGLQTGDSATVGAVTFTFSGIGGTSYGPSTAVPSAAGAYSVTPSNATVTVTPGADQADYPPPYAYVAGTLVVTPAPIIVPVNAPKPPPKPLPVLTVTIKPFNEGSYALGKKLLVQIKSLAKVVKSRGYHSVELQAYTDNVFTPAFNAVLNQNRARAVQVQLTKDLVALGDTRVTITIVPGLSVVLVSANASARGRADNRRVVATLKAS